MWWIFFVSLSISRIFFFPFKVLQVSFGQLLPPTPPTPTSSWEMLCLQQALGSSGGTSLAEMRYCTLVLVMAPCFCRRWSRSWLLWRKCRLHFSHCGKGKERGCESPWAGDASSPRGTKCLACHHCTHYTGGRGDKWERGGRSSTWGHPIPGFQQLISVYGMHKGQSPSGDDWLW